VREGESAASGGIGSRIPEVGLAFLMCGEEKLIRKID
jgi:hypothetical protein